MALVKSEINKTFQSGGVQSIDDKKEFVKDLLYRLHEIADQTCKNIMFRKNWTCCNTCGVHEIFTERDEYEKENPDNQYLGYFFFHQQEADRLNEQIQDLNLISKKDPITIYFNWGYFEEHNEALDPTGENLFQKIKLIIDKVQSVELVKSDFSKKLVMNIKI